MKPRSTAIKSPKLSKLRREIERWRKSRSRGSRMPDALWTTAAELSREHGLNKVATALGLDYYSLKKRLECAPTRQQSRRKHPASFVEIALPDRAKSPECVVELEHPGGVKMRVELKGMPEAAELETVARALWRTAH